MTDAEIRAELRRMEDAQQEGLSVLEARLSGGLRDTRAELAEMRRKQADTAEMCATERERNRGVIGQVEEMWKAIRTCSICKNDPRLAQMETSLRVVLWVVSVMATAVIGGVVKMIYETATRGIH